MNDILVSILLLGNIVIIPEIVEVMKGRKAS